MGITSDGTSDSSERAGVAPHRYDLARTTCWQEDRPWSRPPRARELGTATAAGASGGAAAVVPMDKHERRLGVAEQLRSQRRQSTQIVAIPCDVTGRDEVQRLFGSAVRIGRLDVVVNNAGSWHRNLVDMPTRMVDRARRHAQRDVSLHPRRAPAHASPPIGESSSTTRPCSDGGPRLGQAHYAAAKAGVGLDALRCIEAAPGGVRVNAVAPISPSPAPVQSHERRRPRRANRGEAFGRAGEPWKWPTSSSSSPVTTRPT